MKIKVCTWKACKDKFSEYIITRLENDIKFYSWKDIQIEHSACMGQCKKGANMTIEKESHNYMTPAKASEIVVKKIWEKWTLKTSSKKKK